MNDLKKLRKQIDKANKKIIIALANRFEISSKISILKVAQNIKTEDKKREKEQMEYLIRLTKKYNLNQVLIATIFRLLISESKKNTNVLRKKFTKK